MKKTELVSKCCGAEMGRRWPIFEDGYSLGKPYYYCTKCDKPCEVIEQPTSGEEGKD